MRRLLASLALVLSALAGPATGENPAVDPRRLTPEEEALARSLAEAAGSQLLGVEGVVHVDAPPCRGRTIEGTGEEVRLQGLTITRLRFADLEQADAYLATGPAASEGAEGRLDPLRLEVTVLAGEALAEEGVAARCWEVVDPLEVTWGDDWTGEGSSDAPPTPPAGRDRRPLPADLARRLGRRLLGREQVTVRHTVPSGTPLGEGFCARLDGASVTVLTCPSTEAGRMYIGYHVDQTPERRVVDQREALVVLVEGPRVADPAHAAHLLRAAWGSSRAEREAVGVLSPRPAGEEDRVALAALAFRPVGPLYRAGANVIRQGRERGDVRTGPVQHWFLDPATRNHIRFRSEGTAVEAWVTDTTMLFAMGVDPAGARQEKDYLEALLRALGVELPTRARGMIELLDGAGGR